jgi:hypothetical protein
MTFDQWYDITIINVWRLFAKNSFRWWHGYLDFPPVNDSVMALPAGKSVTVQLAGNVAFTSLGPHPEAFWPGGL